MTRQRIIATTTPPSPKPETIAGYLAGRFTYFTREQWVKEISDGRLTLAGLVVTDPAMMVRGGEVLAWDGSGIVEPEVDARFTILYEDEWFVAVNKTGNLPVHPSGRYFNHTLVAMLEDRYGRKVYPVHRIDRETSGAILLAFDGKNVSALSESLAKGSKEYLALVHGIFPDEKMIVALPLGRDTESAVSKKRKAWPGGTETAVTRFHKILTAGDISLVRCFPETGRLHQIRAHLQSAGFPIIGDKLYGRDETAFLECIRHGLTSDLAERLLLPRQALHASRINFVHPYTQIKMMLSAPLPKMFADFVRARKAGG